MTETIDVSQPDRVALAGGDLLPLDAQRSVTFKDHGQCFTYFFRRISAQDWLDFFSGISFESERVGSERVDRFDFRTAGFELVQRTLERVEGYKLGAGGGTTSGGGDLMELANWKARLPYGHVQLAASLLQKVTESKEEREFVIQPDLDEVFLDAVWEAAGAGKMNEYRGLIHRFRCPSAEDRRRFNRATSEARVVGGTRTGRTIYPGRQKLLAELYDQLVESVEGYGVAGQELKGAEQIRREMDAFHKVSAVQLLFVSPDQGEEEGA